MRKSPILYMITLGIFLLACVFPWGTARAETTIQVTETHDELNNDGDCSLREAIRAANTNQAVDACPAGSSSSTDTIVVPPGTYSLSLPGKLENDGLTGDLDITSSLVLTGGGVGNTILDAHQIDRVLHVISAGSVTIRRLTIRGGSAPLENSQSRGGGIFNQLSDLLVDDVLVTNNEALTTGGGMDNFGGTLTVRRTTVKNNHAKDGGGVFNGNQLVIENSLLNENTADESGGGLDNNSIASLRNVTFSSNHAGTDPVLHTGLGGGIFSDAIAYMTNLTIYGNSGVGFVNEGEARLSNVLIASNNLTNCNEGVQLISEGHNLEDTDSCQFSNATDLSNTAPLLQSLDDNGGPTKTYALQENSPAIDNGSPASCPNTDQRGGLRPADGDHDGDAVCDIGAYEYLASFGIIYLPLTNK